MEFPIIDMKYTGIKLKMLCRERGIKVKDIQEFLQLASVQSVYDWYHGRTLPSVDNLLALSRLLSMPMESLLVIRTEEEWRLNNNRDGRGAASRRLSQYYARCKKIVA